MARTARIRKRHKGSAINRIEEAKRRYGDAVTIIQETDRKPGSPSKWRTDYTRMIFWLALAGMTEMEMSNVIGISDPTFNLWKKNHPDFLNALEAGRAEAVAMAAHSLFRAGIGYELDAVKIIPNRVKTYDPVTGRVIKEHTEVLKVPYKKHLPPNVTALTKFLAAKYPEVWGDRSEVHHTGTVNHAIDASKLSKKQLKLLKKLGESGNKAIENE